MLDQKAMRLLAGCLLLQLLGATLTGGPSLSLAGLVPTLGVVLWAALLLRRRDLLAVTTIAVTVLFAGSAQHETFTATTVYGRVALLAHATRWAAPLLLFCAFVERTRSPAFEAIARVSVSATFLAHGVEALCLHPNFSALLDASSFRLLGATLPSHLHAPVLVTIGAVDVLVALALLMRGLHNRALLIYMCFWGAITAASRSVSFGLDGVGDTLLRSANWGIPLVLCWLSAEVQDQRTVSHCGQVGSLPRCSS